MGAKPAKPECPTCIACESCANDFGCETFLNNEFIAKAGTSGVAQQNHWEFDFKDALKFVFSDCKEKTGKGTSALLPFCNMSLSRDECTETRTLPGKKEGKRKDVTITSMPYEGDCLSKLCTQNGSDFEKPKCTAGKIHEWTIQREAHESTLSSKIKEIAGLKLSMLSLPKFVKEWESEWNADEMAAEDSIALKIATCNDVLSGECIVNGSTRHNYSKSTCDGASGDWASTQKVLAKETNLSECERQLEIRKAKRDTARQNMYRAYAINAMHVERGVVSYDSFIPDAEQCTGTR